MKNKLNKKGFTLVELLAVIVVLAIIMVIAFTSVNQTIKSARAGSLRSSAEMLIKNVANNIAQRDLATITIACDDTDANTANHCTNFYEYSDNDYLMKVEEQTVSGSTTGYNVTVCAKDGGKFSELSNGDLSIDTGKYSKASSGKAAIGTYLDLDSKYTPASFTPVDLN